MEYPFDLGKKTTGCPNQAAGMVHFYFRQGYFFRVSPLFPLSGHPRWPPDIHWASSLCSS